MAAMIHDDVKIGMPPRPDLDKTFWLDDMEMVAGALSEVGYTLKNDWTAGDLLIVEVTRHAKHTGKIGPFPATNKKVENPFFDFLTIRDGKIAAVYSNPLYAMKQLGLFPPKGGMGPGQGAPPKK